MTKLIYELTPEFKKDFKRLKKRYKTLVDDLETVKKNAIELKHVLKIDNQACFEIPGCVTKQASAFKVKKFSCKSLRGGSNSGLRLIYLYISAQNKILLLEIYYKGDKANENKERILEFLKNFI